MTDSSNSSNAGGNTSPQRVKKKQISCAKRWVFVLNNWTEEQYSSIVPKLNYYCEKWVIGKEVGASGTPHLQGFARFKKKCRPMGILNIPQIHWEIARGKDQENFEYCSKDGDFEQKGFPPPIITINRKDFYPYQEELAKIFEQPCPWDDRTIYWRYGDVNIGKTQFVKWLVKELGAVVIGGTYKHMLAQVQNSPYTTPLFVCLLAYGDEEVSYRALEQIKDGLFTTSFGCDNNKQEIRNSTHLLIIGNEPPNRENRHFHPTKYNVARIGPELICEPELNIPKGKKLMIVDDD